MKYIVFILLFDSFLALGNDPICSPTDSVLGLDDESFQAMVDLSKTCSNFALKVKDAKPTNTPTVVVAQDSYNDFAAAINSVALTFVAKREKIRDKTRFDFEGYEELRSERLCNCLSTNSMVDQRVSDASKNKFGDDQLRKGVSKVFSTALRELQGNVTKFKNLNLDPSLNQPARELCSAKSLADDINNMRTQCGNPTVPFISSGSSENFDSKLADIFGTTNPDEITEKLTRETVGVEHNTCLSRQQYMHMKSSQTNASTGAEFFDQEGLNLVKMLPGTNTASGLVELLSYDLFFNLGYRNQEFSALMKNKFSSIKGTPENFYKLYDDHDIQKKALEAISTQCTSFKENLKEYLCSDNEHRVNSKALSVIVRDEISIDEETVETQNQVDYFTKKYSCKAETPTTPGDLKFNDFIEKEILLSKASQDVASDNMFSEYNEFNHLFCGDKKGQSLSPNDLYDLTKGYFDRKKNAGVNLTDILKDPAIARELNIVIDPTKNPIISHAPGIKSTELPILSKHGWDNFIAPKLNGKLTALEIDQLFAILEMQTNVRAQEVKSVRDRFIAVNPLYQDLTPQDVDSILRGEEFNIRSIQLRFRETLGIVDFPNFEDVSEIYNTQQQSRSERFVVIGPMPDVVVPGTPEISVVGSTSEPVQVTTTETQQINSSDATAKNDGPRATTQPQTVSPVASIGAFTGGSFNPTTSGSTSNPTSVGSTSRSNISAPGSSTSDTKSRPVNPNVKKLQDEIKQIRDEIAAKQKSMDESRQRINSFGRNKATPDQQVTGGNPRLNDAQTSFRENYNFPRNLPVKTEDGSYYMAEAVGSELSSASDSKNKNASNRSGPSGRSGGGSGGGGTVSSNSGSRAEGGSGGGGSASLGSSPGRGPASSDADEKLRQELNLPVFEYPRYIPHSLIDMVGSVEKVVIMLGLEGKLFKTIEAIEEFDEKSGKIKIKYIQRYYDFVPGKNFKEFSEEFSDKDEREKIFKEHFTFARTPENLPKSKKLASATREIHKEDVEHSFVLGIQNNILSDDEIRGTIDKAMELLK